MPVPDKYRPALRDLVHELVSGNYESLEADGRAGRLSAGMLRDAVADYPATLVDIPDEALKLPDPIPLREGSVVAIDLDLWTAQEGQSDLTLSVEVEDSPGGVLIRIADLHVL